MYMIPSAIEAITMQTANIIANFVNLFLFTVNCFNGNINEQHKIDG